MAGEIQIMIPQYGELNRRYSEFRKSQEASATFARKVITKD